MTKFYRVDKRDFDVGNIINSAGEFIRKNPPGSELIERAFEEKRPKNLPAREQVLFVFLNEVDAKRHWSKMKDGKLYEIEVVPEHVFHHADMQLVDEAFRSKENTKVLYECADRYWKGEKTNNPRIEILVKQGQISSIISKNDKEREQCFSNYMKGLPL